MMQILLPALAWLIAVNAVVLLGTPERQLAATLGLLVPGIPLLGWITWNAGAFWGMVALLTGALSLRWPPLALWRRLRAARLMGPESLG